MARNILHHGGCTQVPFSSSLGVSQGLRGVSVSVLIPGDAAQLCLPPQTRGWALSLGLKRTVENPIRLIPRVELPGTSVTAREILS